MKGFMKISLTVVLAACIGAPVFAQTAQTAQAATTPTGYTSASDVQYVTSGKYIYNWGVRDEDATFLSTYAQSFYTGSYVYSVMSDLSGGTGASSAPSSALYSALKTLMTSKHSYQTTYDETRQQYRYTDCEAGGGAISCFYTAKAIGPTWDSGRTWNREHTWPNSKGDASGKGENDIMMLRPTDASTNSSRGNKAYGEGVSTTFYDPDQDLPKGMSVRGDCARTMLYVYTRWGNTGSMWGASGVMESLSILLKWMEEDPVDTWEMGRNDAVQAITGTRNVFVDYPEYAFLLFGADIPDDMTTPSGEAKKGETSDIPDSSIPDSSESDSSIPDSSEPDSSIPDSSEPDSSIPDSSEPDSSVPDSSEPDSSIPDSSEPDSSIPDSSKPSPDECTHAFGEWSTLREPTADKAGLYTRTCGICGLVVMENTMEEDSSTGCRHAFGEWTVTREPTEDKDGLQSRTCSVCGALEVEKIARPGNGGNSSTNCNATVLSPIAMTLIVAAAYVVGRRKEN